MSERRGFLHTYFLENEAKIRGKIYWVICFTGIGDFLEKSGKSKQKQKNWPKIRHRTVNKSPSKENCIPT